MSAATHDEPAARIHAACEQALANCRALSRQQALHFLNHGYVLIRDAFPTAFAERVRSAAWAELQEKHGVAPEDPRTWASASANAPVPGYFRTAGPGGRLTLKTEAPRAFAAIAEVVGGAERLPNGGSELAWAEAAVANLGGVDLAWEPPAAHRRIWHKDGWHFRHFLDSPEQGLLVVPFFSDVRPRSGGTCIATDSIAPVARLLAAHPEGLHPDGVQGGGYLIPGLIEQCNTFAELTGTTGDMAILHPYMLHRPCPNPSPRPRFIANAALVLQAPMRFSRPKGDYSLVELAVLRALGEESLAFGPTQPRERVTPGPFRHEGEKAQEAARLREEMGAMAQAGVLTPAWGTEFGYGSNRDAGSDMPPETPSR